MRDRITLPRPSDATQRPALQQQQDDDRSGREDQPMERSPGRSSFQHKLMKRPRSPGVHAAAGYTALPPLTANRPKTPMPLEEKMQRQMRSFLQNFLANERGQFQSVIDLHQHALDSGITVTDATLQEVVNTVPHVRGLRLTGCTQITDAGIWAIARQCAQLDAIYLAGCERITELGLRLLAHNCRLVVVDLSDCPQLNDTILQTIAAGCWMIQTFIMKRCQRISDAGIVKIAQCCKDLRHLDVSECDRVGEYGDKALVEIGRCCPQLRVLDLFGCRHVHDLGVRAIARGCPLLTTLKLTGCQGVSSVAIQALARQCHELEILSLAGCVKTTNQDLRELAIHCQRISWLDISGSPNIDAQGVRFLAQNCASITYLNLANCQRVGDAALDELARGVNKSLTTLSLAGCARISESGVDALTTKCTNLTTLDLTDCAQIGRRFLQKLVIKLEFVEWASTFFGYQPLPNAAELCRQRDRRLLELRSCIQIQSAMRGCLARGGLWQARLRFVEKRILPKIQARVRGFLVRKQIALEKQLKRENEAARIIGRGYRDLQLRRMLARARRLRRIRENEDQAALIFQKIYRGYCDRKRVAAMRETIRQQRQFEARIQVMLELAAIKVQRAYRGHQGRSDAALKRAAREANRRQAERELHSALYIQRLYRGHQARKVRNARIAELLHMKKQQIGAVKMQKVFRGHKGRRNACLLREEAHELRRINAAMTIQRHWRGLRDKHLAAVLLGLIKLRAHEHVAARKIQGAYRIHASKGFMKAMRLALQAQARRLKAAMDIQRVLRGHRARGEAEVQRELQKLQVQARPLFAKEARLKALVDDQRERVESLTHKLQADEDEERMLTVELGKTMQIKTKYHDSSRITGTPQRYLTQYLQVQLADQLRAKRVEIALDTRNLEALTLTYSDTQKQLRLVRRELEPLTDGVVKKTRANRTKRLQDTVRLQRWAATSIQRVFRGFRVRCAVAEGGNCWIEMWDAEARRAYYYNTFSGLTRWQRPLAMDIFQDRFAQPISLYGDEEPTIELSPLASSTRSNNEPSSTTGKVSASNWFEAFDDRISATYYFNRSTKEYQWTKPDTLDTAFLTDSQATRRRHEWLEEQLESDDISVLLSLTQARGQPLGAWETRVDPVSEHFFYYHSLSGTIKASLSPRSVHASLGEPAMVSTRRTARSIGIDTSAPRSLHWQYRYGYEYDPDGRLVPSKARRPIWTEHVDQASGWPYFFNALTNEYRWEKPVDFEADYESFSRNVNPSREWFLASFASQQQPSASASATATATGSASSSSRSQTKTRSLGKKWIECVDDETQNTYYYNEITGETRWSLSPRSAHDTSDQNDQLSLALHAQVKQLRESPVPYSARDVHMQWLETAITEKNWLKVGVLVDQIFIREQSQVVTQRQNSERQAKANDAVAEAEPMVAAVADEWTEMQDEAGNTYYVNGSTGETSWSQPTLQQQQEASEWTLAYDEQGNAYYYNTRTGEASWTEP